MHFFFFCYFSGSTRPRETTWKTPETSRGPSPAAAPPRAPSPTYRTPSYPPRKRPPPPPLPAPPVRQQPVARVDAGRGPVEGKLCRRGGSGRGRRENRSRGGCSLFFPKCWYNGTPVFETGVVPWVAVGYVPQPCFLGRG